jgi:hypothetical protein
VHQFTQAEFIAPHAGGVHSTPRGGHRPPRPHHAEGVYRDGMSYGAHYKSPTFASTSWYYLPYSYIANIYASSPCFRQKKVVGNVISAIREIDP